MISPPPACPSPARQLDAAAQQPASETVDQRVHGAGGQEAALGARDLLAAPPVQEGPAEDAPRQGESVEDVVRRGRWSGTPWVMLGGVAAFVWLTVAVVAGVALLVWWLA